MASKHPRTAETRAKISASLKGKVFRKYSPLTEEHKQKISAKMKGYKPSLEHRRKVSIALKGRAQRGKGWHHSKEVKEKIRQSNLGRRVSDEQLLNTQKHHGALRRERMRKLSIEGAIHTEGEWELLKQQYNFICPSCGKSEPDIKLTKDHIIPISRGGSDRIENIQPLCQRCNSHKFTKAIKY